MPAKTDVLDLAERIDVRGVLETTSIVPETNSEQKKGFDFRPLTEEEKKEFLEALEIKSSKSADQKVVRLGTG